jgi:hypothetical protein
LFVHVMGAVIRGCADRRRVVHACVFARVATR